MIVFVPVGRDVTLSATLSGDGVDAITTAQFQVYRITSTGEQVLDNVQGAVNARRATCTWTARGPSPTETTCSVFYRVTAGDLRAVGVDEIVVFRNQLQVTAFKDLQRTPQPGALCALRVTVDPEYTPPQGAPEFRNGRVQRTNAQGVTVFDNLPPGQWEASFRSPYFLTNWTVPGGVAREAIVQRLVRARFVSPNPATLNNGVHKQWVNLTTDPTAVVVGHADHGPVLKVRAEVVPDGGPGRTGDRIFLKATFGRDNSLRNDPAPSFEGTPGGKGVAVPAVSKALTADGGEVEFTVHLGMAGGDAVTLALGGTPDCQDASMVVVNWRKVFIHPVRPRDYVLPNDQLSDAVKAVMTEHLAKGFVEAVYEDATVLADNSGGMVVGADITRHYAKLPQGQDLIFLNSGPEKPHYDSSLPKFPPRLHLLLGHVIATKHVESQVFPVTSRRSDWRTVADSNPIYKVPFDGTPLLGETRAAAPERPKMRKVIVRYTTPAKGPGKPIWGEEETGEMLPAIDAVPSHVDIDGTTYPLTDDCVEIHEDTLRFRIVLPTDAARLVSKSRPGTVSLKISSYSFQGGSSTGNWVSAVWAGAAHDLKGAITILHELGHSIGLAPVDVADYPGLPASHAHTYGPGGTDNDQRGHQGPHCAMGLTTAEKRTPDYSTLIAKGRHGSCIMFGGMGPKTKYNTLKFCTECLPYLRAVRIMEL